MLQRSFAALKRSIAVAALLGLSHTASAESDLYRVAWTDNPSTTATIGWRQVSGTSPRIEYGTTSDGSGWKSHNADEMRSMLHPDDSESLDTQFAFLTGLTADTAYYFKVCDSEGCSDQRWFKTAPSSAKDMTFVAGGDSRTNREPRQIGNALVAKIRPLFVLFNGDFTDDGTLEQWEAWLEDWQLTESEDGRVYPIVATHGNHENDVIDMLSLIFGIKESGYYTLDVGGNMIEIFTLNSETEPGVGYGAYSGQDDSAWNAQTSQFAADAAASTATWKIGNYHRPMRPHTSAKTEGTGRIEAWAETFTDNGFELIVESDTHMAKYTFPVVFSEDEGSYQNFKRDDEKGTMLIGEGSWGAPTRPTDDDKPWTMDSASFWQFKLVHASATQLDIRTVRFGNETDLTNNTMLDTDTVTALTQAEQDADAFAIPEGLPLWAPLSGEVIELPVTGFEGAKIDNVQYVGSGATWSYLDDGSSPEGWTTAAFNDNAWATGNAQFGYGDGDEETEVSFGGDADNKYTTTYFRKRFNVADASKVIKLTARLLRDDGAVLYINGQEALRSNMPGGEITSSTFAANGIGGSAESTYYEYMILPSMLVNGENIVAVEVHQSSGSSSDLSFDLDLTAVVSNVDDALPAANTTIAANPLTINDIEVTWNDDESFEEFGYQLERKVADGNWKILTWRIEADVTRYTDTKLDEGQKYSYRVRPYNAAGLGAVSNEIETATLSNPVPRIFFEDFNQGEFGEFITFNAASNADWQIREYEGNSYAYMNGYGADMASDDWLITPAINVGFYNNATFSFETAYNYGGPLLKVKYSSDYSGSGDPAQATWIEIPECGSTSDSFCWNAPSTDKYTFEASELDVTNIPADTVHFAFHYASIGTGGGDGRIWQVDNITLRGHYQGAQIEGNDLANGVPANWTNHSAASDANWEQGQKLDISGVFINGYGADAASNDWLIVPAAGLTEEDNASLVFDYYQKYSGSALKIMVSTNYVDGTDPATADWSNLNVQMPSNHDAWQAIGPIDLAGYTGNVSIAFVYQSTGTGPGDGASMGIANVQILRNLDGVLQQTVVASETFDSVDTLGSFTAYSRASNADWVVEERGEELGAIANGFGADAASDDWLISPELSILNWQNGLIRFNVYTKYGGPPLEVKISNNYSGSGDPLAEGVTWTTLPFVMNDSDEAYDAWTAYELDVSAFTGNAYIAFHYTSVGTGGGDGRRLGVDNFEYISTYGQEGMKGSFSAGQTQYTTIQPVNFTASISGGEQPYSYAWDFGDGSTSSEEAPTYTYTSEGTYTVSLTVTDANDIEYTVTRADLLTILQSTEEEIPAKAGDIRVATFNAYLNRSSEGQILADAQSGEDEQIKKVAEIIQRVRPEVLVLQEFDYVAGRAAVDALKANYLQVSQNGAEPIEYRYVFLAESNTGIMTEFDLDNNGVAGSGGGDAYGYGDFPGQYGMVVLSQHEIVTDDVRTFQKFLWKDMPNAKLPEDPTTGQPWYSEEELAVFRLSSKSHWDVPVKVDNKVIHVLVSHPTPPVFDGAEDRNGLRNHDENRFWYDYVDPAQSSYIYDDNGKTGGLGANRRFVITGDLNASTDEGDATDDPIGMLFSSAFINGDVEPTSLGGVENASTNDFAATHTADWRMRADYVLPSVFGTTVEETKVFWPSETDVNYHLVGPGLQSSDHRMVWADMTMTGVAPDDTNSFGSFSYVFVLFAVLLGLTRRVKISVK